MPANSTDTQKNIKKKKKAPVTTAKSTLMKIVQLLCTALAGFAGGFLSPWIVGWIKRVSVETASDAYAIANTYIVFTTIIFVGVTVLLAIAGYVITQQFSAAKSAHEHEIIEELIEGVRTDEELGVRILEALLENPDVMEHLQTLINNKVNELVNEKITDSDTHLQSEQNRNEKLKAIRAGIGKKKEDQV
jgi:uncharacterized Tic20 family protein